MALMGAWLAATRNAAPEANVPVGLLTAYLVVTGIFTVKPPINRRRAIEIALAVLAFVVSMTLLGFGIKAASSSKGTLHGIPTFPFFLFGGVALLATIGDVRLIRAGGAHLIRRTQRLTRHLWRLGFAHAIAVFSFFLGQAKVLPKEYRILPLLAIPPLIALGALFYWLWRVRLKRSLRRVVAAQVARLEHAVSAQLGR